MAAKENQGLQAIVIVLTILVLLLGVGLLLVNNSKKTERARADAAEKSASDASGRAATAQSEATTLKEWIGFGEGDSMESLTKTFEEDKARLGANMEEASRKYKPMLENIAEENRKLVSNEATAKQEVKDLKDRLLAVEAQKQAQVKEAQDALTKAADDAAAERAKFEQQYAATKAEKDKIAADMKALQTTHTEAMAAMTTEQTALKNTVGKLEHSIDVLNQGLPEVDEFAQPADGRISYVNQRHGKVWIDLGSADGLRPQVTFKVAAEGDADAEAAENKGSIEVLRITDAHLAEARITSDDPKNPLMPGDRIYSAVWDRGRQVGFGVAGFIDWDKDRKSDLEELKRIIAASNGRVDAAPDATGKKEGEMKVETRYLILGEYPEEPRMGDLRTSWTELSDEAERLGIETVPLEEFLKLIGWQVNARSVTMGPTSNPADFPPEPHVQELPRKTGQPAGVFKKRLPGISY